VKQQYPLKVYDEDGTLIGDYSADLFVDNRLIIELKAAKALNGSVNEIVIFCWRPEAGWKLDNLIDRYPFMSRAVEEVAMQYVHGEPVKEGALNRIEAAIRAYDPCLSCSTHAVGQMPLLVQFIAPDGSVLSQVART
jgi:hypothetical protein